MRQSEIKYLRHPNGRGKLYGDADVSTSAYLSADSTASASALLRDTHVKNASRVGGDAKVLGGWLNRCYVVGSALITSRPVLIESIVLGGTICGDAIVKSSLVRDQGHIYDKAVVVGLSMQEPLVVEGSARVYGTARLYGSFALHGRMRVSSGDWERPPRYAELGFESVTESKLGAMVGCRDRTVAYWLRHGPALGRRWGLTELQIKQLTAAVEEVGGECLLG